MLPTVVFASPEVTPFSKTGGLADVSGALPQALKNLGLNVLVFTPLYRESMECGIIIEPTGVELIVPVGKAEVRTELYRGFNDGVTIYFIKNDKYYDRPFLYGPPGEDYPDNLERFVFFSRAILEALKALKIKPRIIHCNDWQTGLVPAYIKDTFSNDPHFTKTATVFTIHNIAYQGLFAHEHFGTTGLDPVMYNPGGGVGLEFWGKINLLKAGIVFSEVISTVSKTYSLEIQTPDYGCGLEGVLRSRAQDLYGITNGVDYALWNPEVDTFIAANYSADELERKQICKAALAKEYRLKLAPETPLIGVISRLATQKGLDILVDAAQELLSLDIAMVVLGVGDEKYRLLLEALASHYPTKFGVRIAFDNALAHRIEAGSDMFLMPSRYEPCGLNQLYSLRYGTIPIVRSTGGLNDTIRDYHRGRGTGFKFKEYSGRALVDRVKDALKVYKRKNTWHTIQLNGMKQDFSWLSSARKYKKIYSAARRNLLKV